MDFLPKVKIEVMLESSQVKEAIEAVYKAANANTVGDGKIFILPVENAARIRTGESGKEAL